MSTQWEIDLILNMRFTCIRLTLSYSIPPRTPIKECFYLTLPPHIFSVPVKSEECQGHWG